MRLPQPDTVLEGDFWPEPVRVVRSQALGMRVLIEAVGEQSRQLYSHLFSQEELDQIRFIPRAARDFSGRAEAFFLGIEALRIGFAHIFDPLLALNASQVDPLPHQIEAVYHYILKQPRIRFLLADDPGAGKTIMAGLVFKELKYRGLVQRVLLVVPGHLRDQWLREMKQWFGESFLVVDREVLNASWGRNIWNEEPQVITSMDFAKQDDVMASLAETRWDLVIVDEAHKMAAYRYGEKTAKTDRYRLGELLSRISNFLLFLTATPHRGDPENFRLFLELLQPGMFADTKLLQESIAQKDNLLFLRRLKEDLKDFDGRPLFPPRQVYTRTYRLSDDEKRLYNAVTNYVAEYYNRALKAEKRNVAFALLILQRRLASSVRAIRCSLERRKRRLEELLLNGQWRTEKKTVDVDEDELEDAPEAERFDLENELLAHLTAAETKEELEREIQELKELIRLATQAEKQEVETKLNELRKVLEDERIRQTGEKLLIFTESRDTLDYLVEKLKSWGYSVVPLHGAQSLDERIRAEHQFREEAQIMVSTEAGGEGINLQFCSIMVNYDIPWNPNRLEQRMGRIHRYGQRKEVHIYNLVAVDTVEGEVLNALFRKLERMAQAMGSDRVFDVIGEITRKSLRDLIVDAITNRISLDEIIKEIEAVRDEEAIQRAKEAALEALATRHIDMQRILGEQQRARENRLVPEYTEAFFQKACAFLGIPLERRRDGLWRIERVPSEVLQVSQDFKRRYGEVFSKYSKIAFHKELARQQDAQFVAPGHPLLERVIDLISERTKEDLRRGAWFADPEGKLDGWIWFVEGEIRDGNNEVAGKQIFAVYQSAKNGDLFPIQSSVLWDLKPLPPEQNPTPAPDETPVVNFVTETLLEPYRQEIHNQRQHYAGIKRKYGLRSLDKLIAESGAKLIEYEIRRRQNNPVPEAEIKNEERRKEELEQRKKMLQEQIARETKLTLVPPKVIAVARVVPIPDQEASQEMVSDAEIEAIGMKVAIEYERSQGRFPEDVSLQNLGYDIRSTAPDGTVRYIEVKARAHTGSIALTPNEWFMAHRFGPDYWLYIVEHAAENPTLHLIQDPASKLRPEEEVKVVRLIVKDWKEAAQTVPMET